MIETMISGVAGSDCVAGDPMEAVSLAQAQNQALLGDVINSSGNVLPAVSPYTLDGDQARPGPVG